jgi:hypothetical protein
MLALRQKYSCNEQQVFALACAERGDQLRAEAAEFQYQTSCA